MVTVASSFAPLRTNDPVDVDAQISQLPRDATTKGIYIRCVLSLLPKDQDPTALLDAAGLVGQRKFQPLSSYPVGGFFRLSAAVAKQLHPGVPLGEALRRVGWTFYATLAESIPGRIVFGMLGREAQRVLPQGHMGWKMSGNFGRVETQVLAPKHVRYTFQDYAFVETMQAGVVEGALRFCGVQGRVLANMKTTGTGALDVLWT